MQLQNLQIGPFRLISSPCYIWISMYTVEFLFWISFSVLELAVMDLLSLYNYIQNFIHRLFTIAIFVSNYIASQTNLLQLILFQSEYDSYIRCSLHITRHSRDPQHQKKTPLDDEVSSAELTNYTADALLSVQCNVYTCITAAVLRAFHPPIAVSVLLGIAL